LSESGGKVGQAAIILVGVALVGISALQTIGVLSVLGALYFKEEPDLSDTLDLYLDGQIDAGYEDPVITAGDPLLRNRKILLFHDVNSRSAKDVSSRLMYLNAVDPKAPIDLYISTQGGWSDNAFTIIDTMRTISAPVNTWAIGGCYSSGALILAAATGRRHATEDAVLMIHTNLDDSKEANSLPRLSRERYERVYRERTKLPEAWYPMTDNKTHYLSPQQALEYRVVDAVVPVWKKPGAGPAR
jgi:ATP-dependent Clp protease protease subunit